MAITAVFILALCTLQVWCDVLHFQPIADYGGLGIDVYPITGEYRVTVGNKVWLQGQDTFITQRGKVLSVKDKTLHLTGNTIVKDGWDDLGVYTETVVTYTDTTMSSDLRFETRFRLYEGKPFILFGQEFHGGDFKNTSIGDPNKLSTGFPSFTVDKDQDLGFLAYGGIMFGDTGKETGQWSKDAKKIKSGLDSGPLVLFDRGDNAMVISPFNHFMAQSAVYTQNSDGETEVTWGLFGRISEIPDMTHSWTILYYSDQGINHVMSEWGYSLQRFYKKESNYRDTDFTLNYLGYWTDGGAYYYYNTEPNKTEEQSILDVKTYADGLKIPFRYVQYDSWFYPKSKNGGVSEWVGTNETFPHGMQYVWEQTGWPAGAHNRWWSFENVYAKENGGKYNFIIEPNTGKAIPLDGEFWDDLLRESKKWGLILYEQDWLNEEFDDMEATVSSLSLGRDWLRQMGNGARKNGMTIQYCMSPSRHAMQSLEIPVVTQARASDDYRPSSDQWKIGISSIFAHSMNIAPFKDTFWTTPTQTGNPYGEKYVENYASLEAVVATLSTGPVGPSDKIGCSDAKLLMKSVNEEGLLLQPDRPAMAVDEQIKKLAYEGFKGEVWATRTEISGFQFGIIFGADFGSGETMKVTPKAAGVNFKEGIAFSHITDDVDFSEDNPLTLKDCSRSSFCLYYIIPTFIIGGRDVRIYGEVDKWVPVSADRTKGILLHGALTSADDEFGGDYINLKIRLEGAVGETINYYINWGGELIKFVCTFPESGTTTIELSRKKCIYD